ncbi:MAG TPA: ASPIC/UnbV domain-containing protein [Pyrinomonadaceae bacterium]
MRNDGGNKNHWLGVKLAGTKSNRDGIGAKVTVTVAGVHRTRQLLGGTSYCSASDGRVLFGMAASSRVDDLEVRWPSGKVSTLKNVALNQYITVKEK